MAGSRPLAAVHRLTTDADAPRAAREAAAQLIGQLGCGQDRAEDLALVVSELVTNAVVHGRDGALQLRFDATPMMIRVEVTDGGTAPFEWPADTVDGHWGLNLVSIFSDRAGLIREPATCVWCELDLNGAAPR